MIPSIIQPKRPIAGPWKQEPMPWLAPMSMYPSELWVNQRDGFTVISAVEVVAEGYSDRAPQYHISMSKHGRRRVPRADALMIVKQFDLEDAEEDNHVPGGYVRNFWRPVAERDVGRECPCKDEETAIVEDKGDFEWRQG